MKKRLMAIGAAVLVAGGMLFGVAVAQTTGGTVLIATGDNFPDALGAASTGNPLLLVSKDFVPSATASALSDLKPSQIYIVGGTAVISTKVEDDLKGFGATVTRLSGPDRYATAAAVAEAGIAAGAGVEGPQGPPGDAADLTIYVNRLVDQKLVGPSVDLTDPLACQASGVPADCISEVLCDAGDVAIADDFYYGTSGGGRPAAADVFLSQRNATGDGWVYNLQISNTEDVIDFTLGVVCMSL